MRGRGHVFEAFTIHVAIEMILAPVSDEQIGIAVVVEIARADSFGSTGRVKAERIGYVAKLAVALIAVHAIRAALPGENEQVKQTVVIVIDERDTAAGGLDDVLLRSAAAVRKRIRQTCLLGDVAKVGRR